MAPGAEPLHMHQVRLLGGGAGLAHTQRTARGQFLVRKSQVRQRAVVRRSVLVQLFQARSRAGAPGDRPDFLGCRKLCLFADRVAG